MERINEERLMQIITEEMTKSEVQSLIKDKIDSEYRSNDFDKAVRKIAADVVDKLFKLLWQKSNTWKSTLERK